MTVALTIVPIFLLILLGAVMRRWFGLRDEFWPQLDRLIYYILFPALLFHTLSHFTIDVGAATPMLGVAALYMGAGILLGLLARPLLHAPPKVYAATFQSFFRFNSYVGLAIAGSLHGAQGLALPAMLNSTLGLLSQASLPMGLIAVGSGLRLKGLHSQRGTLWYGVTAKLLIVPAIAWGLAILFGLNGVYFNIAVLMAALPVSTMAYVLATRMGGDGDTIAAQVMLSTLLAALTLPLWLFLLGF